MFSLRLRMIHFILRLFCRFSLWINFRKIYIERRDRLPEVATIIFGLNHPTAFIDPIALGSHTKQNCWYMLRGDMFVNGFVRWFLHSIRNLPIYRERDGGRTAVKRNIETMAFSTDQVLKEEPTIILSEGVCKHERRLRTIQRGTARMMFQAWKKDREKPVCIVPVGANYTAANDFRSSLTFTYGEPIFAKDYKDKYKVDPRDTVDEVTAELQRRMRELVIHVEDPKRDALADKLLPIIQHSFPDKGYPPVNEQSPFTWIQYEAIEQMNAMDQVQANSLDSSIDDYLNALAQSNVTDSGIANPGYGNMGRAFFLWLLGSIAILGFLINFPIAAIIQSQAKKMVKNPQFFASVRWSVGLGIYLVYCLIWMILLGFIIKWFALLIPVVFYLLGYFYLLWFESFKLWRESARIKSLSEEQRAKFMQMRKDILAEVGVTL